MLNSRLEKTVRMLPACGARILDAGCNDGEMGWHFKREGNCVIGVDVSSTLASRAAQRLDGVTVCNLELPWPFRSRTFDYVVLAAVLEHVFDTAHFLHEAGRVLRDDGSIIVVVPNVAYLRSRIQLLLGRKIGWIGTGGQHIRAFTKPTLETLLRRSGFAPTRWWGNHFKLPKLPVRVGMVERILPNLYEVLICSARKLGCPQLN